MSVLQDERYQEILQLLESVSPDGGKPSGAERTSVWRKAIQDTLGVDAAAFFEAVAYENELTFGTRTLYDLRDFQKLEHLVESGRISTDEAELFLAGKYGYDFDGIFAQFIKPEIRDELEGLTVEGSEEDVGEATKDAAIQVAALLAQAELAGGQSLGPYGGVSLSLDQLPSTYNSARMQQVLDNFAAQLELVLSDIRSGRINFNANSIHGAALRPGSIAPSKVDPVSFWPKFLKRPGVDDALALHLIHDTSVDRWHSAGNLSLNTKGGGTLTGTQSVKGPGRVWRVASWRWPSNASRPNPGPIRYRLLRAGARLGVLSIVRTDLNPVAADHADARYSVLYGMVIRGIPGFHVDTPRSLELEWVGDVPVQLVAVTDVHPTIDNGNTALGKLFEPIANQRFNLTPSRLFTPFGMLAASNYMPSQDLLDDALGLQVSLITGVDSDEVYGQLNGRPGRYAELKGHPVGPSAMTRAAPMHRPYRNSSDNGIAQPIAPAPAAVVRATAGHLGATSLTWAGSSGFPNGNTQAAQRIVNGVPFLYADCKRLVPRPGVGGHFSVVVTLGATLDLTGPQVDALVAAPTSDMAPGAWWTVGARLEENRRRAFALDLIVR